MSSVPTFKFSNGNTIPGIGLGTWQSKSDEVVGAVEAALKAGYRHIDAAFAYGNEKQVGEGIAKSGVPRSEIFITSKLWSTYHSRVEEAINATLANLGTDYLDLYLMHWPVPLNPNGSHPLFPVLPDGTRDLDLSWDITDTWRDLEAIVKSGKVRAIGLSNCSEKNVEKILAKAEILPVANQLELHVYNPQHKLIAYLKSKNIVPQAYSPLGSTGSPLITDETVVEIAKKHSLQPADILLGYLLAKDIVILPKSVTPSRIESNFKGALAAYTALKSSAEDVEKLDGLAAAGKQKRFVTPPWPVDLGFDNWPKTY